MDICGGKMRDLEQNKLRRNKINVEMKNEKRKKRKIHKMETSHCDMV